MWQSHQEATAERQLHRAKGVSPCCPGARGSSAFVGGFELVDLVPVVASSDEGGDFDLRIEADPGGKNIAENAVNRRRREGWGCILGEANSWGPEKGCNLFFLPGYEKQSGNPIYLNMLILLGSEYLSGYFGVSSG